jgi:hypothetical protein
LIVLRDHIKQDSLLFDIFPQIPKKGLVASMTKGADNTLIQRKVELLSGFILVSGSGWKTWKRDKPGMGIYIIQESLLIIKVDHPIPIKLVKPWFLGELVFMDHMDCPGTMFDQGKYLCKAFDRQHPQILHDEHIEVSCKNRARIQEIGLLCAKASYDVSRLMYG